MPVTLARPSMREVGFPRWLVAAMALSLLLDPLVGLRLRAAACRLAQRANGGPPR
jgi:hypothetical protein